MSPLKRVHLLHVRLGVLLGDDFDRGREELVTAGVIAVRMGVDDRGHRLVRDGSDLVHDPLAPVRRASCRRGRRRSP